MAVVLTISGDPQTMKDFEYIKSTLEEKTGRKYTKAHVLRDMIRNWKELLENGDIEIIDGNTGKVITR